MPVTSAHCQTPTGTYCNSSIVPDQHVPHPTFAEFTNQLPATLPHTREYSEPVLPRDIWNTHSTVINPFSKPINIIFRFVSHSTRKSPKLFCLHFPRENWNSLCKWFTKSIETKKKQFVPRGSCKFCHDNNACSMPHHTFCICIHPVWCLSGLSDQLQ